MYPSEVIVLPIGFSSPQYFLANDLTHSDESLGLKLLGITINKIMVKELEVIFIGKSGVIPVKGLIFMKLIKPSG